MYRNIIAFKDFDISNLDNIKFAAGGIDGIEILTQEEFEKIFKPVKPLDVKPTDV